MQDVNRPAALLQDNSEIRYTQVCETQDDAAETITSARVTGLTYKWRCNPGNSCSDYCNNLDWNSLPHLFFHS